MQGCVFNPMVVRAGHHHVNLDVGGNLDGRAVGLHELGLRRAVGDRVDIVDNWVGIELAAGRSKVDRVGARLRDLELTCQLVGIVGRDRHRSRVAGGEVSDPPREGSLVVAWTVTVVSSIASTLPPSMSPAGWNLGVLREVVIDLDRGHHRRREHGQRVVQRLGVAPGHVVVHRLLDVVERELPGIVIVRTGLEILDCKKLAVIDAEMELDVPGANAPVGVHREDDLLSGHDFGVAWFDVLQASVGRPNHIGKEGALGGVEDALGLKRGVEEEDDGHAAERVEGFHEMLLVDDLIDFDVRTDR